MRLGALGLSALLLVAGCDDGPEATRTPTLQLNPASGFLFAKLAAGEFAERAVEVSNSGAGVLILADIELRDRSSEREFTLWVEEAGERRQNPRNLRIAAGESLLLIISYEALDESVRADEGTVVFASNDPDNLDVQVPITTADTGGEIDISPRTVDFGAVEAGETGVELVTIRNNGLVDLIINRMAVQGSQDFSARLGERVLVVADGEPFEPLTIPSGESIVIEVTYSPARSGADQGQIQIASNDAVNPVASVNLIANGAEACIRVTPESLEFGAALLVESRDVETPNTQGLSIQSCGSTPLQVRAIEFMGSEAFGMNEVIEPAGEGELFSLPAATAGEAFPARDVAVGFWPTELSAYGGTMLVHSNAEGSPTPVQLFGRGVDNTCPVPVATPAEFNVQPLEVITLDGSTSFDDGGQVVEWEWTVVDRPNGSVSEPVQRLEDPRRPADGGPADDTSEATAQFFVDLAGTYTIELRVRDNLGQWSCDPTAVARVVINAVPEKDLHIQLVWSTPGDPDETDNIGTDVDLHFMHEDSDGRWGDNLWDCYFANTSPDWGIQGDVADNPSLDIDDTNGAGPENVNLARPEPDVTYEVGALYFRAESTFGVQGNDPRQEHASFVTARIFVRGELLAELVDTELSGLRQLWHIVSVRWCDDLNACPEITIVDQVLEEEDYLLP